MFFLFLFGAPMNIYCFNSTVSGCDGGDQTRNIADAKAKEGKLTAADQRHLNAKASTADISVVDPKLFFPDPDPTLTPISDPDPNWNPDPACL
jgi:hypothetical protein